MNTTPKIFLTNLRRYVEGALVGEWVEMPISEDDLDEILVRIEARHPDREDDELFITDFEGFNPYKVGEYDRIDDLNEIAEFLNDLDECSREDIKRIGEIEDNWDTIKSIFENGEYTFYAVDSLYDLGEMVWDECGNNEKIPDELQCYIDYERYARDLYFHEVSGGYLEIH